jgi:hypothetical protein
MQIAGKQATKIQTEFWGGFYVRHVLIQRLSHAAHLALAIARPGPHELLTSSSPPSPSPSPSSFFHRSSSLGCSHVIEVTDLSIIPRYPLLPCACCFYSACAFIALTITSLHSGGDTCFVTRLQLRCKARKRWSVCSWRNNGDVKARCL